MMSCQTYLEMKKPPSHRHKNLVCLCVCFQADALQDPIHAVLGGPEPDVDTVAATLCLALHLSQVT